MKFIGVLFSFISLFGFIGLFKITKLHQRFKITKRWQSLVVGIVAALIANPFLPADTPKQEEKPAQNNTVHAQQPAPSKPQSKPKPLEQVIKEAVTNAIGSETNDGKYHRISNLMILPDDKNEKENDVVIEVNADENLTEHLTALGMLMDAQKIFQATFPCDNNIAKVVVNFYLDMVDPYGQTSHDNVLQIILTRDTYKKINWNNFDYHNFPTVADDFRPSPAVQKALQE